MGHQHSRFSRYLIAAICALVAAFTGPSGADMLSVDVVFESRGQNMWGPVGTAAPNFDVNVFSFNLDSGSPMHGASTYGEFGAFAKTTPPRFCFFDYCVGGGTYWVGADLDLHYAQKTSLDFRAAFDTGSVDVTMPYEVTFDVPDLDNLKAGDVIRIDTSVTAKDTANISTSFPQSSFTLNLNGDIDMEAILEICTGGCVWKDLIDGSTITSSSRHNNHHFDYDVDILRFDSKTPSVVSSSDPASFGDFIGDQARGAFLPALTDNHIADIIASDGQDAALTVMSLALPSYGFESLSINTPDIDTAGGLTDGRLQSSGDDNFTTLDWDLDILALASTGCQFPIALLCSSILGTGFSIGDTSGSYDLVDFDSLISLTASQTFDFQPILSAFLEIGAGGKQIAFTPGDTIEFVVDKDTDFLELTPFFDLDNQFSQTTTFGSNVELETVLLQAALAFDIPGWEIDFDALDIIPFNTTVGIAGKSFDDTWGPHDEKTTTLAETDFVDWSSQFQLGGFSTLSGPSFVLGAATAVAEPATLSLFGTALLLLGYRHRNGRSRHQSRRRLGKIRDRHKLNERAF